MSTNLLAESVAVGIILVIVSFVVLFVLDKGTSNRLNLPKFDAKYYVVVFGIGILTHLLCEVTKINHWYCKNGSACRPSVPSMTYYY